MPRYHEDPPKGYPHPHDLLRDPSWMKNYPLLFLRGVQSIMARLPGDPELRFFGAFNLAMFRLLQAHPPRLKRDLLQDGILTREALTKEGLDREKEVRGEKPLSPESIKRYGKRTPRQMRKESIDKLEDLNHWIEIVRATTSVEDIPPKRVRTKITGLP
jgi:hypothetical protein